MTMPGMSAPGIRRGLLRPETTDFVECPKCKNWHVPDGACLGPDMENFMTVWGKVSPEVKS